MRTLTKKLSHTDRCGDTDHVTVAWQPLNAAFTDPAFTNVGWDLWIWNSVDDCPVFLVGTSMGVGSKLVDNGYRGSDGSYLTASKVESVDALKPGCYCVVEDSRW